MRGLNQQMNGQMQASPNPIQSVLTPQNIQLLAQAYKGYMNGQPTGMGDMGTSYPNFPDPSAGTGYQLGQPLLSGGLSGQPSMIPGQGTNPSYQSLVQALSNMRR